MCQDDCLNPCISCIDDGHPPRPAKPRCGDRESQVYTACPATFPASYPPVQTATPSFPRAVNLPRPLTEAPLPVNE